VHSFDLSLVTNLQQLASNYSGKSPINESRNLWIWRFPNCLNYRPDRVLGVCLRIKRTRINVPKKWAQAIWNHFSQLYDTQDVEPQIAAIAPLNSRIRLIGR